MKGTPLTPVRLTEIPVRTRLLAAREAARTEHDGSVREELLTVALFPSDQVYWVPVTAQQQAVAA